MSEIDATHSNTRSSDINIDAVIREYSTMLINKNYHRDVIVEKLIEIYKHQCMPERIEQIIDEVIDGIPISKVQDWNTERVIKNLDRRDQLKRESKPIQLIHKAYSDVHCGDYEIAESISLSYCSTREMTNSGVQPKADGITGSGKTAAFEAGVFILPQEDVKIGSLSNKALFYDSEKKPGTVYLIDDAEITDEMLPVLKSAMGRFQQETIYRVVNKERKGTVPLTIPPRCVFLFTSCDDIGDEQLVNRFFQCSLDRKTSDFSKIAAFYAEKDERGEALYIETENVKACREMMADIGKHTFIVKIPFARQIGWHTSDTRLQREFVTILKAHAVLNWRDREHTDENVNPIVINASLEDFHYVYEMSLFKNKGSAEGRFNSGELKVIKMLHELRQKTKEGQVLFPERDWYVMRKQLAKLGADPRYHISNPMITYALRGRNRDGKKELGLVQKIPGLIIEDLTTLSKLTEINDPDNEKEQIRGERITVPFSLTNLDTLDSALGIAYLLTN